MPRHSSRFYPPSLRSWAVIHGLPRLTLPDGWCVGGRIRAGAGPWPPKVRGVDEGTLCRWESGRRVPAGRYIDLLQKHLQGP